MQATPYRWRAGRPRLSRGSPPQEETDGKFAGLPGQTAYPAEWKQKYLEILRKRIPELKKAGLYDIAACYGFDEASSSEWEAVVDLLKILKAEFPDLKVVSTAVDESYGGKTVLKNTRCM